MKKLLSLACSLSLLGCVAHSDNHSHNDNVKLTQAEQHLSRSQLVFTESMARENLIYIKNQYLKMLNHIENNTHLVGLKPCLNNNLVCFPRAEESGEIYLEQPAKWTNGFFPGLLWKLLAVKNEINTFTDAEQEQVLSNAKYYQAALMPEAKRNTTHDLGFILYDSFGEALMTNELSEKERAQYLDILSIGRGTLSTRFDDEKGVIKSWDFLPTFPAHYLDNGIIKKKNFDTEGTWQFPVIVDNMMNLEFLLASDNDAFRNIAFSHAKQTYLNHYFYAEEDSNKAYPIAYHLFDYDSMRPGNWQGIGNVSAWARGQGWSLYGFVTVLEAFQHQDSELNHLPDFELHVDKLVNSIERLMQAQQSYVPSWDFFALYPNAQQIAENQADNTAIYHRMLDLCDFEIEDNILPYAGYRPIQFSKTLLSNKDIEALSQLTTVSGESFVQGDYIAPCGTKPYKQLGTHIPKDSSAAALIASALYRLAQTTVNPDKQTRYIQFADKIMAELTQYYLTSQSNHNSQKLGFVLSQATGNLPNASEIDTSIVYADFYFLEANIRKLALLP